MPHGAPKRLQSDLPLAGCVLVTATTFGMQDPGLRSELERSVAEMRCSPEPPPAHHPLLRRPQVIATPHSRAHADDALNATGRMTLDACLAALRGERPAHVVNPELYAGRRAS
jgi:hypothetical protein